MVVGGILGFKACFRKEDEMDDRNIFIDHGTDYKEMTKELLRASDLIGRIPDRSCRVGIKPNLVSPSPAS